jgi:rod shape determining protein RodA
MFDRRLIQNFDWTLLLLLALIAVVSVVNLYSATYPLKQSGGSQIFVRQICWFAIGFFVFLAMTTFDYHILERFAYSAYFFSLALLVLVLLTGKASSGSQRWLSLFGFNMQPSELMKLALIAVLAKFFNQRGEYLNEYRLRDLWQPFILIALPVILIIKEPDLGTALVLVIVSFSIILFAGIKWKSLLILGLVSFLSAPFFWLTLKEYQKKRILTFLRPDLDPLGAGYHINQSKIAIGSGLLWGKGFLRGTQTRLNFLPEQHTDFAFSVLAEEWGFIGSAAVLMLYLFLVLWGVNIAKNSKDQFGAILALGIMGIIFWELLINVCMVTGLLPVVGIPLAMFSYGGSSVICCMAGMGILMNISMRRFMFQ